MSVLIPTTTGTILDPGTGDPYETADPTVVTAGIAAHLSAPSGSEVDRGGQLERIDTVLLAPAGIGLDHTHLFRDDGTGQTYRVSWVEERRGLGLDHTKAGLARYQGGANGG